MLFSRNRPSSVNDSLTKFIEEGGGIPPRVTVVNLRISIDSVGKTLQITTRSVPSNVKRFFEVFEEAFWEFPHHFRSSSRKFAPMIRIQSCNTV